MNHRTEEDLLRATEIKSVTPYRASIRRPTIWLVRRDPNPISPSPAREFESIDSDSRSDPYLLAA